MVEQTEKDLRALAETGDAEAQFQLGKRYFDGDKVARNVEEAINWFVLAAEQGQVSAQNCLGYCYFNGVGTEQDIMTAVLWFRKASEAGHPLAQFNLAQCYQTGMGVPRDGKQAVDWLRKSAEQNYEDAQYELARCYQTGDGVERDLTQAADWFAAAADQGFAAAQASLGDMYRYGDGVGRDLEKAVALFEKAANKGNASAQNKLGLCYYNGEFVPRDYKVAVEWFRKAADQGHEWGQQNLGECFRDGEGVEADAEEAAKWFQRAAQHGLAKAQDALGDCYRFGEGVAQDDYKAAYWYRKAAEQGRAEAQVDLGNCYYKGIGVPSSHSEAVNWFKRAARQGYSWGQNNLGECFRDGDGVPSDHNEAARWFRKAALQGLSKAQFNLALCYIRGTGMIRDPEEGERWMQKAAGQGLKEAKAWLDENKKAGAGLSGIFPLGDEEEFDSSGRITGGNLTPRDYDDGDDDTGGNMPPPTHIPSKNRSLDEILEELDKLIGLETVKDEIGELCQLMQFRRRRLEEKLPMPDFSNHLVFTGNPGTGKTTVARMLGEIYRAMGVLKSGHVVEVDRSRIVGMYIGETAQTMQKLVESALDGILFIDEAYNLVKPESERDFGREAVEALVKLMEDHRDRLVVIVAGYTAPMMRFLKANMGLQSRFKRVIEFPDFNAPELEKIFNGLVDEHHYRLTDGAQLKAKRLFESLHRRRGSDFANARTVRTLFEDVLQRQAVALEDLSKASRDHLIDIQADYIPDLLPDALKGKKKIKSLLEPIDELIGLDEVKKELRTLVNLMFLRQQRKEADLPLPDLANHFIFTGNPGTGKTTIARMLGKVLKELGYLKKGHVIEVDRGGLVAGFVGQTAQKVTEQVDLAMDGILFIDEAYSLAPEGSSATDFGSEAIATLLKLMEDHRDRIVVICAGYKDQMQSFVSSNPGLKSRFNKVINFPDYTSEQLFEIYAKNCADAQLELTPEAVQKAKELLKRLYAQKGDTFGNGRDVRNLFEVTVAHQAGRLADFESLDRRSLLTVEQDDIPELSDLSPSEPTVPIGFRMRRSET